MQCGVRWKQSEKCNGEYCYLHAQFVKTTTQKQFASALPGDFLDGDTWLYYIDVRVEGKNDERHNPTNQKEEKDRFASLYVRM